MSQSRNDLQFLTPQINIEHVWKVHLFERPLSEVGRSSVIPEPANASALKPV